MTKLLNIQLIMKTTLCPYSDKHTQTNVDKKLDLKPRRQLHSNVKQCLILQTQSNKHFELTILATSHLMNLLTDNMKIYNSGSKHCQNSIQYLIYVT